MYRCDGPDCQMHVQTTALAPVAGWLQVIEGLSSLPDGYHDFCSWDCLLKRAAWIEPVQAIVFGGEDASRG